VFQVFKRAIEPVQVDGLIVIAIDKEWRRRGLDISGIVRRATAALLSFSLARPIAKDTTHHLSGCSEEPDAAIEIHTLCSHHPKICLMDERRGLKGGPLALTRDMPCGKPPQLVINERHHLFKRARIAFGPAVKQQRDVAWMVHLRTGLD